MGMDRKRGCMSTASSSALAETFTNLVERWRHNTAFLSSVTEIVGDPVYRAIIALGMPVVPLILRDLLVKTDHWFVALRVITGEDPAFGEETMLGAALAWIEWGMDRGLLVREEAGRCTPSCA